MARLRSLFRWKPTPRHVAVPTAALGLFGLVAYSTALVQSSSVIPTTTSVYFVLASALMVGGGASLWHPSRQGWWLSWASMIAIAASGLLPFDAQVAAATEQTHEMSRIFQAGFMVTASGFFFSALSHPDVYRRCFEPGPPPRPLFVGTPLLLVLAGAGIAAFDPMGLFVGPLVLFALLISGNLIWMARPLLAAFKATTDWHAG